MPRIKSGRKSSRDLDTLENRRYSDYGISKDEPPPSRPTTGRSYSAYRSRNVNKYRKDSSTSTSTEHGGSAADIRNSVAIYRAKSCALGEIQRTKKLQLFRAYNRSCSEDVVVNHLSRDFYQMRYGRQRKSQTCKMKTLADFESYLFEQLCKAEAREGCKSSCREHSDEQKSVDEESATRTSKHRNSRNREQQSSDKENDVAAANSKQNDSAQREERTAPVRTKNGYIRVESYSNSEKTQEKHKGRRYRRMDHEEIYH